MNLEIRKRISDKDKDAAYLGAVFMYWNLASRVLESLYKNGVLGIFQRISAGDKR